MHVVLLAHSVTCFLISRYATYWQCLSLHTLFRDLVFFLFNYVLFIYFYFWYMIISKDEPPARKTDLLINS